MVTHITNPGLQNGIVVNQNPSANQAVPTSTQITLTVVQNPQPPTPTPSQSATPTASPTVSPTSS